MLASIGKRQSARVTAPALGEDETLTVDNLRPFLNDSSLKSWVCADFEKSFMCFCPSVWSNRGMFSKAFGRTRICVCMYIYIDILDF